MRAGTTRSRVAAASLLLGLMLAASAEAARLEVSYDPTRRVVSVVAEQASLTGLLGRIALLTGLDVQIDPGAEQAVSLQLHQRPVSQALEALLRPPLGHLLVYEGEAAERQVTSVRVYPPGTGRDDSRLVPLLDLGESDALTYARLNASGGYLPQAILDAERHWQQHFAAMSADEQALYRQHKQAVLARERERQWRAEQRRLDIERRRTEAAQRQQAMLERLRREDPDGYQRWIRQRDAYLRQRVESAETHRDGSHDRDGR